MKGLWVVELDLNAELARECNKYGVRYIGKTYDLGL